MNKEAKVKLLTGLEFGAGVFILVFFLVCYFSLGSSKLIFTTDSSFGGYAVGYFIMFTMFVTMTVSGYFVASPIIDFFFKKWRKV
jgi:hypothetical protein